MCAKLPWCHQFWIPHANSIIYFTKTNFGCHPVAILHIRLCLLGTLWDTHFWCLCHLAPVFCSCCFCPFLSCFFGWIREVECPRGWGFEGKRFRRYNFSFADLVLQGIERIVFNLKPKAISFCVTLNDLQLWIHFKVTDPMVWHSHCETTANDACFVFWTNLSLFS